jgi:hypothetical protein
MGEDELTEPTMTNDLLTRPTMRSIARALTAQDLATCAQDVISWQDKGVLANGPLNALAARFVAETGIDEASSLQHAEAAVLREASLRFIATQTGLRADQSENR